MHSCARTQGDNQLLIQSWINLHITKRKDHVHGLNFNRRLTLATLTRIVSSFETRSGHMQRHVPSLPHQNRTTNFAVVTLYMYSRVPNKTFQHTRNSTININCLLSWGSDRGNCVPNLPQRLHKFLETIRTNFLRDSSSNDRCNWFTIV